MGTSPTIPEQYANQQVGISGYRVLNLDLDGVCADYAGAMRDYLVRNGRMDPQTIPANTRYALTDNDGWPFASKSEYIAAHKAAEEEHLYATMQPRRRTRLATTGRRTRVHPHRHAPAVRIRAASHRRLRHRQMA